MSNDNTTQSDKLLQTFEYFYAHITAKHQEFPVEVAAETSRALAATAFIQATKGSGKSWSGKSGGYNKGSYSPREEATGGLSQKQLNYMNVLVGKEKKNGWDGPGLASYVNRQYGVQGAASLTAGQAKEVIDAILNGPVPVNGAAPAGPSFNDQDIPF